MRFHLRRCVWITLVVVVVQVLVTFWGVHKPSTVRRVVKQLHREIGNSTAGLTGQCNPNLCNPVRDDMLNVHLVAHSHDDVGWLKTLDQYYSGQTRVGGDRSFYTGQECVRCVLNTTIPELLENPTRRFIFIEMAFFSKYWSEISPQTREVVRDLVKQRRLEFVIGGWCMSDSATTFYNDIIDQHALGFDFIHKHFGPCAQSRTAWHVDQFGHSREHSSLFAQMGFDAIILGRVDHQDIASRKQEQTLEMVWNGSPNNLGDKASLFTHLSGGYYSPKGFVMESWAPNKMFTADLKPMIQEIETKRQTFRTNHVMLPLGSDFGFKRAGEWFDNIDILIARVNDMQKEGGKVNLLYSTPSCYFHHVNKAQTTWPTKSDDFFPYAIDNGYWTGYFTSKGGLKLHVKKSGALLQACKQLSVFAGLRHVFGKTHVLKAAVGVLQHHDAITGTEKDHVVKDYNKMLSEGSTQCQDIIQESYSSLTSDGPSDLVHSFCPKLNISECDVSESSHRMAVFVYNPLSRPVTSWIRFPVTHAQISIKGENGEVSAQILPVSDVTASIPERTSDARAEVVFKAELPAMGFSTFLVEGDPGKPDPVSKSSSQLPLVIDNKRMSVTFDTEGRISTVKNLVENVEVPLRQEYAYYESKQHPRASGAYIFAPKIDKAFPLPTVPSDVRVYKGSEVTEVHQKFGSFVSQVVRLYMDTDHLELEWTVGPIPVEKDGQGKEVISIFTSDLKSNGEFYTDSNGRENLKRKRDHRDTWKLKIQQRISGNYYPVTSKIFIQDSQKDVQMTVLTDRCQGGSSINDGQLELMVHRRTLRDDGLGVGEPLNEKGADNQGLILRGKHYLYIGSRESSAKFHREKSLEIHLSPTISFVQLDSIEEQLDQSNQNKWTALKSSLPDNVQILSLDQVTDNNTELMLLRLEHFYEMDEHVEMSKPAVVDLQDLFSAFDIVGIEELSLGANFNLTEVKRLRWKTESGLTPEKIGASSPLQWDSPLLVRLQPMEIRTFHIQTIPSEKDSGSFFKNIFR